MYKTLCLDSEYSFLLGIGTANEYAMLVTILPHQDDTILIISLKTGKPNHVIYPI